MKRIWHKRLLGTVLIVVGVTAVISFSSVWLRYRLLYGSEQRLAQVNSPDGEQIAYFSVKYEGPYPWWPANPQPHFYITVVETASGEMLLRETDYDWPRAKFFHSADSSFTNLARAYAPWAEFRFQNPPHAYWRDNDP
jgi:hypothetical protein